MRQPKVGPLAFSVKMPCNSVPTPQNIFSTSVISLVIVVVNFFQFQLERFGPDGENWEYLKIASPQWIAGKGREASTWHREKIIESEREQWFPGRTTAAFAICLALSRKMLLPLSSCECVWANKTEYSVQKKGSCGDACEKGGRSLCVLDPVTLGVLLSHKNKNKTPFRVQGGREKEKSCVYSLKRSLLLSLTPALSLPLSLSLSCRPVRTGLVSAFQRLANKI